MTFTLPPFQLLPSSEPLPFRLNPFPLPLSPCCPSLPLSQRSHSLTLFTQSFPKSLLPTTSLLTFPFPKPLSKTFYPHPSSPLPSSAPPLFSPSLPNPPLSSTSLSLPSSSLPIPPLSSTFSHPYISLSPSPNLSPSLLISLPLSISLHPSPSNSLSLYSHPSRSLNFSPSPFLQFLLLPSPPKSANF